MSEMVDRVARAIGFIVAEHVVELDEIGEVARHIARVAVNAMRKPTEAMTHTSIWRDGYAQAIDGYLDGFYADEVWQAMVDEALK